MNKSINSLPPTWKLITLEDIGVIVSGGTPSTKEPEFWGDEIPWITPADLSNFEGVFISKGNRGLTKIGLEYSSAVLLPENSVIFSSRAPIGYVAIAKNSLATNQGFKNLILTASVNPKYVYFYLKTIKELAEDMASGTTFLELSALKFKQIPIPLPPLEEQNRIVEKIEELFSELDKNVAQLKESKVKAELAKRKLLDRYINSKSDKYSKLSDLTTAINYGFTAKSFKNKKTGSLHYLRITDIQNGKINWEKVPFCNATEEEIKRYIIEPDDILFARSGNTVGKTIHITNDPKSLYASYLINIRCDQQVLLPKFLSYYFQANFFWEQVNKGVTGIGQPNFNGTRVSNLDIPLFDLSRQNEIVEEIEVNFFEIEKLKAELDSSIERTYLLKSKILQDSFQGKLSKQLPSDTSTEILIIKIYNEKQEYLKQQIILNKSRVRLQISELNLREKIKAKFAFELFTYADLFHSVRISKDKLAVEFEKLEVEGSITNSFDKTTGTIKYKLNEG